jgi:hypothetical protein
VRSSLYRLFHTHGTTLIRCRLLQACIVRVMKDRKQLPHLDLINEVIRLLAARFSPKISMIKQAIERLIEKEYLARDPENRKALSYMVRSSFLVPRLLFLVRSH